MMTLMAVDPAWLGPSRPCCPCCAALLLAVPTKLFYQHQLIHYCRLVGTLLCRYAGWICWLLMLQLEIVALLTVGSALDR